ncbi:DUF2891 domain-containing protein [Halosolutus gelatinilyticus]|uniref:DUF2891 domain-containing protein n=1 Tax=Halosolutus gelatinilyticus TaxID=2931975 RepID=UPI001FF1D0FE|nr:DUF2891 domain-containing protein [Halosolutus gelatinilyticus]
MTAFESVDPERILSGRSDLIDADLAADLSRYPLDSVDTEFPHWVGSIDDPDEWERPAEQHPVFYGCFDWHSAVHSHWCLIRQLRLFDDHPAESEIRSGMDARFTAENVDREVAYFERNESFEKPYGWAWLLRLAAELHQWNSNRAMEWRDVLRPLEDRIVTLVETELLAQLRPFRVGTHQNTAFALQCVLDYARVIGADSLAAETVDASREMFLDDKDYPIEYEPLGWDFLSPALVEADLMRRVLDRDEFSAWIDGFLPDVTTAPYDSLLEPVSVESKDDGGIELHLVGLNLSKAWCLADVAAVLDGHRYADPLERSAKRHAERGLARAFTDDYAGAHWLSSFALYLVSRNDGGIAPT